MQFFKLNEVKWNYLKWLGVMESRIFFSFFAKVEWMIICHSVDLNLPTVQFFFFRLHTRAHNKDICGQAQPVGRQVCVWEMVGSNGEYGPSASLIAHSSWRCFPWAVAKCPLSCSVFYTHLSCLPHSIPVRGILLIVLASEEIESDTRGKPRGRELVFEFNFLWL